MDQDTAVKSLYERFPYPPPIDDLTPFTEGRRAATWNPRDSWNLYFPQETQRGDVDILVAGCGTRAAVMMAACMPEARVTAVDISEASIAISSETAQRGGITNLEHHRVSLEGVGDLGKTFDLIHCHGVLHHLSSPERGLQALGAVLRPKGAMSLMVYADYGRAGLYMLQDLGQSLGLPLTEETAVALQRLLRALPPNHPFSAMGQPQDEDIALAEVMDMLMHPRDVSYNVPGIRTLVEEGGLKFHRWIGLAPYSVSVSPHADGDIGVQVAGLPLWEQWSAMELLRGTIATHAFVVTHPDRASADELFGGDRILDAIPCQAAHAGVQQKGDNVFLYSRAHSLDRHPEMGVHESANAISALFRTFKGDRTIREILEDEIRKSDNPGLQEWLPATCRRLYQADVVALTTPGARTSGG